jgi:hypothetical protein
VNARRKNLERKLLRKRGECIFWGHPAITILFRRKLIADSVEQLLQCLRLFTTFAMLVGNIHKHFLPDYRIATEQSIHNPEVLMFFTLTIGLEMLMFWITFVMTCFKQCRLCCRVGCCKFAGWISAFLFGIFIMYYPFHMTSDQLDMTWCHFEVGTDMYNFFNFGE